MAESLCFGCSTLWLVEFRIFRTFSWQRWSCLVRVIRNAPGVPQGSPTGPLGRARGIIPGTRIGEFALVFGRFEAVAVGLRYAVSK